MATKKPSAMMMASMSSSQVCISNALAVHAVPEIRRTCGSKGTPRACAKGGKSGNVGCWILEGLMACRGLVEPCGLLPERSERLIKERGSHLS
jgi:hypothetical protein